MFSQLKIAALCLGLVAAMVQPVSAATTIDFDSVAAGSTANSAAPAGISFVEAEFSTETDEFGDEIPGSEKWRVAADGTDVLARNPDTFDGGFYGPAPSGPNALDARWAPVLVQFADGIDLAGFSVTLDNSGFGNLVPADLLFLDATGLILATLVADQTVPGYVASWSGALYGVSGILLPSGAYYDNISYSAVPIPPAAVLMFSALSALGFSARRKRVS